MTATLMAGCLVLAAGCGAERPAEQAASERPDTPVSSSPVADAVTTPPPAKPKPVKPTGDAVNPRKVRFTKATPVAKGRQVRLTWWSGVAPCTVLDRVKVKETKKRVTITLYEGPSPKAKNVSCIMIAIEKTTTVKLKAPIGKRKIVDGAKS
ncbi:hypothetical protein [Nonomuraea sp. NPDC048826]|uniref:hypothetical protein n=1 Tax=Nonomuraea sp. NPDC048826 TaxID=3364347 RepID=UPI003711ECA9